MINFPDSFLNPVIFGFIRKAEKGLTRVEQNVLHKDAMQLDSRIISYGNII